MTEATVKFALSTPIQAHGETVGALDLRPPTVKELRECGSPTKANPDGSVQPDYRNCAALLMKICGIPSSSVDQLAASDFDTLAWRLVGFLSASPAVEAAPPASNI